MADENKELDEEFFEDSGSSEENSNEEVQMVDSIMELEDSELETISGGKQKVVYCPLCRKKHMCQYIGVYSFTKKPLKHLNSYRCSYARQAFYAGSKGIYDNTGSRICTLSGNAWRSYLYG